MSTTSWIPKRINATPDLPLAKLRDLLTRCPNPRCTTTRPLVDGPAYARHLQRCWACGWKAEDNA